MILYDLFSTLNMNKLACKKKCSGELSASSTDNDYVQLAGIGSQASG